MAVAIYVRVSTEEQRERQSILTQREFADRFCALHSLAVYRVYADDGVSGTVPLERRPEGGQILNDARQGKFNQLLIYRLDRLGRDTRLILNGVDGLEKLGVRVRSMTEEFDTGSATGRLMLTLLSGFASHERDVIRERSVAGTMRLAEAGAWLGGIVPYGYRKQGENKDARLVIADEVIPSIGMSEADVVKMVFHMAATERKSCCLIAQRLNEIKVPCAYVRDDRLMLRGKRKERTSGVWRPGRVRNLIVNKTYKGLHEYGKRSTKRDRQVITRTVPALVPEKVWNKAQATLRSNFWFAKRNTRNRYLLRGLIKCGLCGLSFSGRLAVRPNGNREFYYGCNGYHQERGAFGAKGQRCPSKAVRGDHLEAQVWADVEQFLRNPGPVLQQLQAKLEADAAGANKLQDRLGRLEGLLARKTEERNRVVSLYRRGRIDDKALDGQMAEIGGEEGALQAQVAELRATVTSAASVRKTVGSAELLLAKLRQRLDGPVSWECKRELIEVLVAGIHVDTIDSDGIRQNKIMVSYRFSEPGEPAHLVLPQAYSTGAVVRIPVEPKTVGDHIRKKRLSLKLLQKQVAQTLGVNTTSVYNWESNQTQPGLAYMPAVIEFLGYNPLPPAKNWADRLVRGRTVLGLSQKELARRLGVDQSTLAGWERGERDPTGRCAARAKRLLIGAESTLAHERCAG